ncbi:unnamed protein product [Rhizophagus irregularis]|uniref:Uncharacterized protein n=1 Tax=Rhizophagus irregularis TaxID=588596 RepID=A0A915ZCR8_9GLOM|nr:unnamed protein product [Rhizophagus irregularis]
MSRFDPNILINGEQTESSSRSSTPNSYRKIEPEIMRRLMNDGKVNNTGIDMKGLELAPTGKDNHHLKFTREIQRIILKKLY